MAVPTRKKNKDSDEICLSMPAEEYRRGAKYSAASLIVFIR